MLPSEYNTTAPMIMHIDLNSCFATVEQQARPLLRGRPIVIVNRRTESTMIVTASYEAKAAGISLGMSVKEAKRLEPRVVAIESDPPKYRYVYHQMRRIMQEYSAHVRMKSIDEGVIDFNKSSPVIVRRDLQDIGREIKRRIRQEIGCVMRCNVGIATNRFLAKTAASLHKPDGLEVITHHNLRKVYQTMKLEDLTGIARRMRARLEQAGIYTPLEFLDADPSMMRRQVFQSICASQWHQRLRGWEVDERDFPLKTAGRQYVLEQYQLPRAAVLQRLHHLAEEVGVKIRSQGLVARGVQVHAVDYERRYWHARRLSPLPFFSDQAIFEQARQLFDTAPHPIKQIGVTCYDLSEHTDLQLSLFGNDIVQEKMMTEAIDSINYRHGARSIHSAATLSSNPHIAQKIPFGSTRYL